MSLISKLVKFLEGLEKNKPFKCGGTTTIEMRDGNRKSKLYCRQPTGKELLNYIHTTLESQMTDIEALNKDGVSLKATQELIREKKLIPFAKAIITGWDGYADPDGKEIKWPDIEMVEKFFPHHLDTVSFEMYVAKETYEKKKLDHKEFAEMVKDLCFDEKGNKKNFEAPDGCKTCSAKKHSSKEALEWQCNNGCEWPENAWKYDEIKYYMTLAYWADADVPLRDIDGLTPGDYMKIKVIRRLI